MAKEGMHGMRGGRTITNLEQFDKRIKLKRGPNQP